MRRHTRKLACFGGFVVLGLILIHHHATTEDGNENEPKALSLATTTTKTTTGSSSSNTDSSQTEKKTDDQRWAAERARVCREMNWAWEGFAKHGSLEKDEVFPVNNAVRDTWGGMGLQAIEALSTMALMTRNGMSDCFPEEQFEQTLAWVEHYVSQEGWLRDGSSFNGFEMVIRCVGGLVSAYELTGEKHKGLLKGATAMADLLLDAWTESGYPIPVPHVPAKHGKKPRRQTVMSNGDEPGLAEITSMQLEYRTLSYHTGNPKYDIAGTWLLELVNSQCPDGSKCPTRWDQLTGNRSYGDYSLGPPSDSYFEYLVKLYLLTDKTQPELRERAVKVLKDLHTNQIVFSKDRTRVGAFMKTPSGDTRWEMEELTCFVGGVYALAALEYDGLSAEDKKLFTDIAEGVAEQCAQLWFKTGSGLALEKTFFTPDSATGDFDTADPLSGPDPCPILFYMGILVIICAIITVAVRPRRHVRRPNVVPFFAALLLIFVNLSSCWTYITEHPHNYILRPETFETLYLTYRLTKNEKYRDYGKRMMDAIVKHCRVPTGGYAPARDPRQEHPSQGGVMHSFFIAETMKYAFLLFSDDDQHNLGDWVFNTEAHPLRRRKREPTEVWDAWYNTHNHTTPWCMAGTHFTGRTIDEKYMRTPAGASLKCPSSLP